MTALNLISSGHGANLQKNSAAAAGAEKISRGEKFLQGNDGLPEKFQSVMERLAGFFLGGHLAEKAEAGGEAGCKTAADEGKGSGSDKGGADAGNSQISQAKSELLPAENFIATAEIVSVAASPVFCAAATGDAPAELPKASRSESAGGVAGNFAAEAATGDLKGSISRLRENLNRVAEEISVPDGAAREALPVGGGKDLLKMFSPAPAATSTVPLTGPGNRLNPVHPTAGVSLPLPKNSKEEFDLSENKMPELQSLQAVAAGPNSNSRLIRPDLAPFDAGTAVAQQDVTMKSGEKMTNFSGSEQKLPGLASAKAGSVVASRSAGENLPPAAKQERAPATITVRVESPVSAGFLAGEGAASSNSIPAGDVDSKHLSVAVPVGVERTREMISLQVMRLQETGADEMRVVIKPDAGLQLSLNLQQRGGNVEVRAVLEHGNFDLFSRHWPELQQQLESRGVRVAPLAPWSNSHGYESATGENHSPGRANADQTFGGGSEGFRQPTTPRGQHSGDNSEPAPAETGAAVLLPGLPPAAARASAFKISSRQLEVWA